MKAAEVQTMMSRGINQVRTLQIIKAVDDDSNDVSMYINVDTYTTKMDDDVDEETLVSSSKSSNVMKYDFLENCSNKRRLLLLVVLLMLLLLLYYPCK